MRSPLHFLRPKLSPRVCTFGCRLTFEQIQRLYIFFFSVNPYLQERDDTPAVFRDHRDVFAKNENFQIVIGKTLNIISVLIGGISFARSH